MKLRMMELRKAAGYESRADFACAVNMAERRVKALERGENKMTLEDACIIADALNCTLDELVGRETPLIAHTDAYKSEQERSLIDGYRGLTPSDKRAVDGFVQGYVSARKRAPAKSDNVGRMENIA